MKKIGPGIAVCLLAMHLVACGGGGGGGSTDTNTTPNDTTTNNTTTVSGALDFERAKNRVSMTYQHVLAVMPDGTAYAWGDNSNLQAGVPSYEDQWLPHSMGLADVKYVSAGSNRSYAIVGADSRLLAWGSNDIYGLGTNEVAEGADTATPVAVYERATMQPLINAVAAAGGISHSVALNASGTVLTWGFNSNGELGLGHDHLSDFTDPATGELVSVDNTKANEVLIPGTVVAISAGFSHTLALTDTGDVYAWGKNDYGQIGDGNGGYLKTVLSPTKVDITDVVQIAAGANHSLALKSDGTVWGWGDNGSGQIGRGDGTTDDSDIPVQALGMSSVAVIEAGSNHSFAIKSDGTLWELGDSNRENSLVPNINEKIVAVAVGNITYIALTESGEMLAWGGNTSGEVGNNTATSVWNFEGIDGFTPVHVLDSSGTANLDILN